MKALFTAIWDFYIEGFKSMTWGRQLWWLILLKVVILFAILRVFFFRPTLAGKDEQQCIDYIGNQLTNNPNYKHSKN